MYLSKLEIFGFKSFANKTNVSFNNGITSIVGPNGCGKTNIVDAIRWCLGEQKSGTLRSDKMENVIFNGTSSKKPMGMAEVSLTIQNSRGILPTEYSEVVISRRIFRSGESEYLLNKNICRLKDITNLFMDTGIGANAYSVIELKMVETILNNKAEERRNMFEEAAGVNKYKLRRRLALKKLDDVKNDLTRVNDIVSEVEKKVNTLERQAKRADKYNKISTQLRELELDLAERELADFSNDVNENKKIKEETFANKIQIESELNRLELDLSELKTKASDAETNLKIKRDEITAQTDKLHSINTKISVSNERKKSLENNIDKYNREHEELISLLDEAENLIEENNIKLVSAHNKILELQNLKVITEEEVNNQNEIVNEKRDNVKAHREAQIEKIKEINGLENEIQNLQRNIEVSKKNVEKLNENIATFSSNIAKTVSFLEDLSIEKNEIEKKLAEADSLYAEKNREKDSLEKQLAELKEKEVSKKGILSSLEDKINFLQNLIENLEGVSKGAKVLLENKKWSKNSPSLLAHIGDSSEEFRFAIEAALKNNLNNIIVETIEELQNGINYLTSNDFGKASFFITQNKYDDKLTFLQKIIKYSEKRKSKKLLNEDGFLKWAEDVIISDDKWKPFFKNLLYKVAIVNTLETALNIYPKYKGFTFVTLNGDLIHGEGVIEAGSSPKQDDTLFGRKKFLENLINNLPNHKKELESLRSQINSTEEKISSIDLKVLNEKGRMLINDIANIEKQISQFEFEKNKTNDEIEKSRNEIQSIIYLINKNEDEFNRFNEILKDKVQSKENNDKEFQTMEEDFKLSESVLNNKKSDLNEKNISIERLLGERKNLENALHRAEENVISIRKSITKREEDIKIATEEINSLKEDLDFNKISQDEFQGEKNKLQNDEIQLDDIYKQLRSKINELESQQSNFRKERDSVLSIIHKCELKLNELNININNLKEHIKESYSVTLELKEFENLEDFNFKERTEEVHSLKQQIKNLGQINMLAYSEYEEELERFNFLQQQRNDLIESEKDVIKTIEEINTTAQALFLDTFGKIRENFITIFRNLFNPGDEADLRIESLENGADPLEAKIEIIAKPKGKRPTTIELLSGGEKTLTAIALLFAIYLVKPSPFCILDEIDAPLDDANIDRFTKIIRDFSSGTQFIIVTHNKRTMEAADTMYGVTMQEEGISKLVGVRFNEEMKFVS